jgi:hypothetical protein
MMKEVKLLMDRNENVFLQNGNDFFYVSPLRTLHRITNMYIVANGTRDLCIIRGSHSGDFHVKEIAKANKDDIEWIPLGDILWLNIDPPYMGAKSLIIGVGSDKEHVKPLVKAMLKSPNARSPGRGHLYDAYAGDDYWEEN